MMGRDLLRLGLCCTFLGSILSRAAIAEDFEVAPYAEILRNPEKEFRAIALERIRTELPGEEVTKAFADLLPDLPPGTQVELLGALASRRDKAAAASVRRLLIAGKEDAVRVAAIKALGVLGGADDLPALVKAMSSGAEVEQAAARRSLVVLPGEKASEAMVDHLSGAPAAVRVAIIEILTTRRARNTVPAILELVVDDDASVRRAAMAFVGDLGEPEHVAGMVQGVLKAEPGRERSTAEKMIMLVCRRVEDPQERANALLEAMRTLPEEKSTILLSTLGRVGGPDALKAIERKIADADYDTHDAGVAALCNWPDASVAFRLLEIARTDEAPGNRRRALRALIRVAPLPDEREDQLRLDLMRTAMAMCEVDDDRMLVLERVKAIRSVHTLRYILPYMKKDDYAEMACLTVVELAHHSGLREAHKEEFLAALELVLKVSKDATVRDRAQRYQVGQTWVRPK